MKKTIKQQIRKMKKVKLPKEEHEAEKIANASIPFIEGSKKDSPTSRSREYFLRNFVTSL